MKQSWKTLFLLTLPLTTCCTLGSITSARAQITPDNSLGAESSSIGPDNIQGISFDRIRGGATRGANLFHSFQEFNVGNGQLVYFSNPAGIGNILTRVTGVNRSNILGRLGVLGNANLFLINPNGIFFGPNSSLDVRGSFLGSTANSLIFDNGFEFSATNPIAPPLLTVNIPIGLRFRDNPGNITNQSVVRDNTRSTVGLRVNPGNSLALVGGNVSLEQGGRLTAAGGRIELGGLAGAGTVGLETTGNTFKLNFPANSSLSNVTLANDALAAVLGNGEGDIAVNANIFTATNGGRLVGGTRGGGNGGNITVNSNEFNISGVGPQTGFGAGIYQQVIGNDSSNAGNITVNTKSFNASSGGQLQNSVLSGAVGNAGNIELNTDNLILSNAQINSSTFGRGNAGNVTLRAENGDISLAGGSFIFSTVESGGMGNAGKIDVITRNLSLTGGSQLQTLVRAGEQSNAGNITVQASGTVRIAGRDSSQENPNPSGIFSTLGSGASGNAGNITINAGSIFTDDASLRTTNAGTGIAGDITLNARDQISIAESRISAQGNQGGIFIGEQLSPASVRIVSTNTNNSLSTSTSNGRAGDISIQATGLVEFVDNDLFSNVLSGAQNGQAGNINIKAGSLSLLNGAQLQSSVDEGGQGNAGNVTIDVPDGTVRIAGRNSRGNPSGIFNNVQSTASGDAGNITINAGSIFTDDASLITTNAGTGIAGDITLNARDQISIAESRISARGNQGGIFIGEQLSPASVRIVSTNTNNSLSTSTSNGRAGDISIQATGLVEFDGNNLFSNVLSGAQNGQAGDITIKAGSLSLLNGAQVQSNVDEGGQGNAGNVTLRSENGDISLAGGSIIFSTVESGGTGNAGKIDVTTRNLSLTGGSQLQTLVRAGGQQGNAGNITVQASGTVRIAGRQPGGNCSGIFSEVQSGASGNAGNITINAGSIFTDDALLRARNTGNGSAGNISLQVGDAIAFTNRTEISSSIFGTGNAGNVTLRTENGDISLAGSNIFSTVDSGGMGNAGKIDIITRNLSLTDGSQLQTLVRAGEQSNAGNITVQASGTVRIAGRQPGGNRSGIFSEVQSGASGNAGNITINASSIFTDDALLRARNAGTGSAGDISLQVGDAIAFTNRTEISSSISGTGNAGNVTLRTENGDISLAGRSLIFSTVESGGTGNAGKIDVTTGNLTLTDGSQLQTLVRARQQGNADNITANAGNITVQASGTVRIAGRDSSQENPNPSGIFSTLGSGVSGDGGNITINAGSIFTDDASLRTTNAGTGSAGSITLNARDQVSILNSRVFSDGDSGFIFIGRQSGTTDNLSLIPNRINIDNSTVSATNNSSSGIAGDIALNARDQVSLNQSTIRSNGNRGRIFIGKNDIYGDRTSSPRVIKLEGSFLNTTNQNITGARNTPFNAGDISIDAIDSISLNNQSFIQAFTERRGDAGNVTLRAENGDISLAGGSDIFSTVESGGTGNAGAIDVTTRNLTLTDGAQLQTLVRAGQRGNAGNITVQASGTVRIAGRNSQGNRNYSGIFVTSTGTGQGGNLSITGNSLTLDRGILSASTASADGGNINLRLRNFLRLQNESLISANAGGQQNGGNGGNIAIDTPFIVAFPQNNDITANAVSGSGGQVRTNATLFGIVPRTRADLERLGVPSLNPRNLPTSDITAFSQQNSSFGDNVQVTSPDVDPSRGLVELPETVTDRTQQIAQSPCQQGFGNEFVVTGRGGLPTTPNQTLSSDNVRVDLLQPVASSGNSRSATIKPATNSTATRVPAQGWIFNDKGQVVLTAYDPTNTGSQRSWRSAAACPAR